VSLRAFHVVFILCALCFTGWFAWWGVAEYRAGGGQGDLVMGVLAMVCVLLLGAYGVWFLRKLRREAEQR
jgi:hypothetical protein